MMEKEITGDCEVKVSEIGIEDVTDFNNCCIWLEMKDNNTNLIYAKKKWQLLQCLN